MNIQNCSLTTPSKIAWAYLQKNRNYQKDVCCHMTKKPTNVGSNSFPCIQQTKSDIRARKWGLLAFADPKQDAPPFWHPDMRDTTILAEMADTDNQPFTQMLRDTNTVVQGLCLLDKMQCLKITSNTSEVQLMFPPGTILDEHSNVSLNLSFDLDLPSQIEKAKALWDIAHGKAKKMSTIAPKAS